jgi:PAS domain S-box-containing protein
VSRWSPLAEATFGFAESEVIGKRGVEFGFVHLDDRAAIEDIDEALFDGRTERVVSSSRNVSADGRVLSCDWYNSAIYDEAGTLVRVLSLVNDVTDRVRSEAERVELLTRYRFLADAVPEILWSCRPDGRPDYFNLTAERYTGLSDAQIREVGLHTLVHPDDVAELQATWEAHVDEPRPFENHYRLRRYDGAYRWQLARIKPLIVEGVLMKWFGACTDVDDQRKITDRSRLIAEASNALASSLNTATVVRSIARLPLPGFADWCKVDLVAESGRIHTAAIAHRDAIREAGAQALVGTMHLDPKAASGVPAVMRAGCAHLAFPSDGEFLGEVGAEVRAAYDELGRPGSIIIAPLRARGRTLGTISFVLGDSGRRFTDDDVSFAEDLALRSAVALDNAQLFEREHRVADTLQRAMLPTHLPVVDGMKFSSAYSPAAAESEVGGDWFDAFPLADGCIAVSIGDVTGHGLTAAVIMGEVRQSIRASAMVDSNPALVLQRANQLLLLHESASIVTGIFGVIDSKKQTFTYASAGHPPPLVAREGDVWALETAGLPLGLRGPDDEISFTTHLGAGSMLVLYTDGLIEFSRDIEAGERALRAAISEESLTQSEDPAPSIARRVLAKYAQSDDIAILAVRFDPFPTDLRWHLVKGDMPAAQLLRRQIAKLVRTYTRDPGQIAASEVVVGELLANAVEHAPHGVDVHLDWRERCPRLIIGDLGAGVSARPVLPTDPLSERGRGQFIIAHLARSFEIRTDECGRTIYDVVLNCERDIVTTGAPA